MKPMKERIGQIKKNNQGLYMKIISYRNNKDIEVKFLATNERRKTTYFKFRRGLVKANLSGYPLIAERKRPKHKLITKALVSMLIAGAIALIIALI